jgi:hypothetical protein
MSALPLFPEDLDVRVVAQERFIRRCLDHGLELDGLQCPEGPHQAKVALSRPNGRLGIPPDEVLAWEVLDVESHRWVARVIGEQIKWAPWFEALAEDGLTLLTGRCDDGMVLGMRRIRHARVR